MEGLPNPPPKLLDRVRAALRLHHYSLRTEQSYVDWIKRFMCCGIRLPLLNKGGRGVRSPLDAL